MSNLNRSEIYIDPPKLSAGKVEIMKSIVSHIKNMIDLYNHSDLEYQKINIIVQKLWDVTQWHS